MPRNHGPGAWVFLSNFGGGLVDGDCIDITVEAQKDTLAFIGTQASTKVYRSPRGCSQHLLIHVAAGAAVALVPDPIVCFEGARYSQSIHVTLETGASVFLLDTYGCGRAARGERWRFSRFVSRISVERQGRPVLVDSTLLDGAHGDIAPRMGRFLALATVFAVGPRFAAVRQAMLAAHDVTTNDSTLCAPSAVGEDGAILRMAAEGFEGASHKLRSSFAALTAVLGDDPFARKW
jgi:urease accessory protein